MAWRAEVPGGTRGSVFPVGRASRPAAARQRPAARAPSCAPPACSRGVYHCLYQLLMYISCSTLLPFDGVHSSCLSTPPSKVRTWVVEGRLLLLGCFWVLPASPVLMHRQRQHALAGAEGRPCCILCPSSGGVCTRHHPPSCLHAPCSSTKLLLVATAAAGAEASCKGP